MTPTRSPVVWPTIPAMVRDVAAASGDTEAVVDGDRRVDFAGLRERVGGAARALLAVGIERGALHAEAEDARVPGEPAPWETGTERSRILRLFETLRAVLQRCGARSP